MKFVPKKPCIYGETLESLKAKILEAKQPAFRTQQLIEWLYKKRVHTWAHMHTLPKGLQAWLEEQYTLSPLALIKVSGSKDQTQKLLLRLEDGSLIETVIIRAPAATKEQTTQDQIETGIYRKTICVSTQVGCAYGCKFCASGLRGWKRDLSVGEIVAQLLAVCALEDDPVIANRPANVPFDNIVIMGMGEPLANYNNLLQALQIVNAPWGLGFGARRITVSTSGLAPEIIKLANEPVQFRLAISLHGATNEVRQQIMPVNKKYPLEVLLPAIEQFVAKHTKMITLEYILIDHLNDTLEQAKQLVLIAKRLHAHVNLIPYNTVQGLPWQRPSLNRQHVFLNTLKNSNVSATIRMEKGHDIDAACGQLVLQQEGDTVLMKPISVS